MEIEAKPTEYAGVMFRSKLESHWARFFDAGGIAWEYEPTRLPGWIPDFLVAGWWLAEVKPVPLITRGAAHDPIFEKAIRPFDTLLLGDGPGDALGLLVRKQGDGIFTRFMMANIDSGEAVLLPSFSSRDMSICPITSIWRGIAVHREEETWKTTYGRKVFADALDAMINPANGAAA